MVHSKTKSQFHKVKLYLNTGFFSSVKKLLHLFITIFMNCNVILLCKCLVTIKINIVQFELNKFDRQLCFLDTSA